MALPQLDYTKNWTSATDFPTEELNEEQVRADMQLLHDEVKGYINETLIPTLEGTDWGKVSSADIKHARLNTDKVLETSADGETWEATGSSGHIIVDKNGSTLPQRSRLKFTNSTVTDVDGVTVVEGVKGDQGDTGEKGDKGDTGSKGDTGDLGPVIVPTVDSNGVMSFSIQSTATPPSSVSVRGPQGPQGVQGAQGATGSQGAQGIQGTQGIQGSKGDKGDTGSAGPTGSTGPQGPTGAQGPRGNDGADGRSFTLQDIYATLGALKTAFPTGNEYAYQVSADKNVYIWSELETDWISLGQLQGPQGQEGVAGATGATGATGAAGAQGPEGPQGVQGPQGPQGAQGAQGIQGVQGVDGKSAYTAAVENGYAGTETTFNSALSVVPDHVADATKHIGTSSKTTPIDADSVALVDSADGSKVKKLTFANLKTALGSVFVPSTRTVNSKALSSNISLTAADVSAVPTTRTVNSKALSADISLTAADVGAHTKAEVATTSTLALYGLGADAVPDEVLAAIKNLINGTTKVATGSATLTLVKYETIYLNLVVTTPFTPKAIIAFNYEKSVTGYTNYGGIAVMTDVGMAELWEGTGSMNRNTAHRITGTTNTMQVSFNDNRNEGYFKYGYIAIG